MRGRTIRLVYSGNKPATTCMLVRTVRIRVAVVLFCSVFLWCGMNVCGELRVARICLLLCACVCAVACVRLSVRDIPREDNAHEPQ